MGAGYRGCREREGALEELRVCSPERLRGGGFATVAAGGVSRRSEGTHCAWIIACRKLPSTSTCHPPPPPPAARTHAALARQPAAIAPRAGVGHAPHAISRLRFLAPASQDGRSPARTSEAGDGTLYGSRKPPWTQKNLKSRRRILRRFALVMATRRPRSVRASERSTSHSGRRRIRARGMITRVAGVPCTSLRRVCTASPPPPPNPRGAPGPCGSAARAQTKKALAAASARTASARRTTVVHAFGKRPTPTSDTPFSSQA